MLHKGLEGLRQIALNKLLITARDSEEIDRVMNAPLLLKQSYSLRLSLKLQQQHSTLWGVTESKEPYTVTIFEHVQNSWENLAKTTFHELGHVVVPWANHHNAEWQDACRRLGLTVPPNNFTGHIANMIEHQRSGFTFMQFCDPYVTECVDKWTKAQGPFPYAYNAPIMDLV